jgi:hypothetical protein|tara:strand:+ start:821 stop:1756 length:936 start_codon:yes stop_codon:yes gene_type:complete
MAYFSKFPRINYSFDNGKTNKVAVNILKRVGFTESTKENSKLFVEHNVVDGDTPEMLAHKVYGDSTLHWVVLMFNDIINPHYDWPMSTRKLESHIKKKYPGSAFFITDESGGTGAFANVHFERNWTVLGVDGNTYSNLQDVSYGSTNAALVHKWDKSLSKIEVTGVSGSFSVGDYVVSIGTSADGSTYNVGAYLARVVSENRSAVNHFVNSIDDTILNPYGAPPSGGTGAQAVVGHTAGHTLDNGTYSQFTSATTYDDTLIQNYIVESSDTYSKTNFEYETEENEKKRKINLIRPDLINVVIREYDGLMNG